MVKRKKPDAQRVGTKVKGKFKSTNPESRMSTVLRAAVQRGLATKKGDTFKAN